jgi:hypothetical protein
MLGVLYEVKEVYLAGGKGGRQIGLSFQNKMGSHGRAYTRAVTRPHLGFKNTLPGLGEKGQALLSGCSCGGTGIVEEA